MPVKSSARSTEYRSRPSVLSLLFVSTRPSFAPDCFIPPSDKTDEDDEVELTEEQEQRRDRMIEALLRADFDEVPTALASRATGGKEDNSFL